MDVQGSTCQMDIRGGTSGDNAQAVRNVKKGAQYIRDLGYFNVPFFGRIMCMLYGRLTWILMQMKIFRVFKKNIYGISQKEVSEIRGFKQLDEFKSEFRIAIKSGVAEIWRQLILFLFGLIQDFALKKKRKKKMPPLYNSNFQCLTD